MGPGRQICTLAKPVPSANGYGFLRVFSTGFLKKRKKKNYVPNHPNSDFLCFTNFFERLLAPTTSDGTVQYQHKTGMFFVIRY